MSYTLRPFAQDDTLLLSRDPIRTNFSLIQDRFNENHVGINSGSGGGKHKFLQMPEQSAAPTTAANEAAVYTKQGPAPASTTELYFRRESNGTEIQMTGAGSNIPVILSGTFASTGSFTDIVELPANVYGYIIFFRTSATRAVQMSPFTTTATNTHGMSSRMVTNSSSDDDPVELQNNSTTLFLRGKTDDFGNQTYTWRLHYWNL